WYKSKLKNVDDNRYTRKGGNKMNKITIYRDWKIVRKLDVPDEIKREINKVLVRLLIEKREQKSDAK
ncbi:MAG: hypothetical protein ACTSPP_08290, partial [Candidatus Heimdallarchaeaceae archaeon]